MHSSPPSCAVPKISIMGRVHQITNHNHISFCNCHGFFLTCSLPSLFLLHCIYYYYFAYEKWKISEMLLFFFSFVQQLPLMFSLFFSFISEWKGKKFVILKIWWMMFLWPFFCVVNTQIPRLKLTRKFPRHFISIWWISFIKSTKQLQYD